MKIKGLSTITAALTAALTAAMAVLILLPFPGTAAPAEPTTPLILNARPAKIYDGDTFLIDINGNGRLEEPEEKVRLLYVDTPELTDSHKGQDPEHGIPARDFLAELLSRPPFRLRFSGQRKGKYGRTLALVDVRDTDGQWRNVNLALVRAGHSPLDTRFSVPEDYQEWVRAEALAFDEGLGIWKKSGSRKKYLARLQREHRTPAGKNNPLFIESVLEAGSFRPEQYVGRFIRLRGTVSRRRTLKKGVELIELQRSGRKNGFPAVVFRQRAALIPLEGWRAGTRVLLEGFIQSYRGKLEMLVHFGRRADG